MKSFKGVAKQTAEIIYAKTAKYHAMLMAAPSHDSAEFIEYLRDKNEVVYEDAFWIVITNCKYDTPDRRWYTAFPIHCDECNVFWLPDWLHKLTWLKKPAHKQTIQRFHIHIYEES